MLEYLILLYFGLDSSFEPKDSPWLLGPNFRGLIKEQGINLITRPEAVWHMASERDTVQVIITEILCPVFAG